MKELLILIAIAFLVSLHTQIFLKLLELFLNR